MRIFFLSLILIASGLANASEPVRVGSKNFNESYLLSEMLAQLLEASGYDVDRRFGLGGTMICYEALVRGEIDVYVEYTGTLGQAILDRPSVSEHGELNELIADRGIALLGAFGFNNTYAIVIRRSLAESRGVVTIGDIGRHPELRIAVSHELLARSDGWPGLARIYALPPTVQGIEHGLAYQAIADDAVDITDAYSTDGELKRYDVRVLRDDSDYFPRYLAAPLVRKDLPEPVLTALDRLRGMLDDERMQTLNAEVIATGGAYVEVANAFLVENGLIGGNVEGRQRWQVLLTNTLQHLKLTLIALGSAVFFGIGSSLMVYRSESVSRSIIYISSLLQTIPSIALLALMIPIFGIGALPAIVALFLYSLLPIIRNTLTALTTIDPKLVRVSVAMGLTHRQRLRYVYLPLSLPNIFSGIRTAAVICIGTATLAAFIGAGGLGDPIVTGLALNDVQLILEGAIPAAVLAIVTELVFEGLERLVLPGHLRPIGNGR